MAGETDTLPPPSYEEAQHLLASGSNITSSGNRLPQTATQSTSQGIGNSPNSQTRPVNPSPNTQGSAISQGSNLFTNQGVTSDPNIQGILPVFVCSACGARQHFGQFSPFVPHNQQIQPTATNYASPPIIIGTPVPPNQSSVNTQPPVNQLAGSATTGNTNTQQQCNVAVHYNTGQERVQARTVDNDNTSDEGANGGEQTGGCVTYTVIILIFGGVVGLIAYIVSQPGG